MSDTASATAALLNDPNAGATPPAVDSATPPESSSAPATPPAATPQQPFLKVNDRTSYLSPEDAIKGYQELQGRVTSLSQWEQLIAAPIDKGGFGITDPKQVAALLDELAEHRTKSQGQQATPATPNRSDAATVQAAAAGDRVAYESLSPEWKAHVDYLNKLGYVTKDALKPIEEKLNAYDQREAEAHAQAIDNAVAHGTTLLEGVIKSAGITVTPEQLEEIGGVVGSAIDRVSYDAQGRIIPNSLADQFLRGNEATRRGIIEKQFELFTKFGESFATAKSASYVQAKQAAQSSQPRTLPQGSSPASTTRTKRMTEDERKKALGEALSAGGMS